MADINTQKFTNVSGDNLVILPDTSKAKNGDVLTFNSGTSGVIWHAPQSGGGGSDLPPYDGNTRAVLVADEGNTLSWDWGMYFATTEEVRRKIDGIQTDAPLDGFGSAGTMFGNIKLWYDETLHIVPNTISEKERDMLSVTNPVPNPSGMNGKVLTVEHNDETNTDDIVWKEAGGGGGGSGNPYTKVSVTPGARYKNGKTSDYGYELFDQDVSISNNTYSIVNTELGYVERPEMSSDSCNLDVLKIKLPANTEFPMAVVEFRLYHFEDMWEFGAVNDVEVYVGETKLTKLLSHPFRMDSLVGTNLYSDEKQAGEGGYGGYYINGIWPSNTLAYRTAFVATEEVTPIVQVNIFGNCFTLSTNAEAEEPSAS